MRCYWFNPKLNTFSFAINSLYIFINVITANLGIGKWILCNKLCCLLLVELIVILLLLLVDCEIYCLGLLLLLVRDNIDDDDFDDDIDLLLYVLRLDADEDDIDDSYCNYYYC